YININQLPQLQQTGNANGDRNRADDTPSKRKKNQHDLEAGTSYSGGSSTTSMVAPLRLDNYTARGVSNGPLPKGEEIAAMLMQVTEKADRCWNFDLDHWLTTYERVRFGDVNFPEAGMLIQCAAQIYGRKVDYLVDIIMHMSDDQKAREKKTQEEAKANEGAEGGVQEEEASANKSSGRKRAGKFNPQSLSDCFSDLEFTCNDKKLAKLESLIKPAAIVDVDRRSKLQQMQDLCTELRANPSRQRRQEILNRLRDDACITPIMSSNGAALNSQILDLESGETIGTRYDFQVHQNYIDGRTGSLIAEHDLKRFFQRCDVMDFLLEQHVSERERCSRLGMPAPADMLAQRERELKLYMPPEYLSNRYRIKLNDTSDFDNALIQARVTNYNSDPILSLMDHTARAVEKLPVENGSTGQNDTVSFSSLLSAANGNNKDPSSTSNNSQSDSCPHEDSGIGNETSIADEDDSDPSFCGVLSSSRANDSSVEQDSARELTDQSSDKIASQDSSTVNELEKSDLKSIQLGSRLSVDEGIGVDRESPPRSGLGSLGEVEVIAGGVTFTGGVVFPRPAVLRPVKLMQNLLGIPEELVRKHVQFALPVEYRKLKTEHVKRKEKQKKDILGIELHSLKPTANSLARPSTPEPEDFLGFDDETDQTLWKTNNKRTKSAAPNAESSPTRLKRQPSPEPDFEGFDEEEILSTRKAAEKRLKLISEKVKLPTSPRRAIGSTLPLTPTRTLSCDSGISDTVERTNVKDTCTPPASPRLKSLPEEGDVDSECEAAPLPATPASGTKEEQLSKPPTSIIHEPLQEHTDASNARIQQSMHEAKERFDKVSLWHRKLKPILIESEKRNHFDIHAYGTEIIDTFDPTIAFGAEAITLERVLQHKPPHSTARFFLSMLMLANTNNVQICNKNQDSLRLSSTAEIELRLLSRKRHHKELEALGGLLPQHDEEGEGAACETDRNRQRRKNRKRKIVFEEPDQMESDGSVLQRPDPSCRLGGLDETGSHPDDGSFLDNVQQLYADLNSEDSQRKRLAFRRGMRSCAYGLDTVKGESQSEATKPSSPPLAKEVMSLCNSTSVSKTPPNGDTNTQPVDPSLLDSVDDLLTVDLLTNQATLVPVRDPDATCAKSVFSLAESGYESMLSGGDDI
uniref:Condensin-2 complex subunit H2 C-terminal domain-containing protein n=1 Tax=Anopheles christyi TaxID=43041 RepID=A0A182K8N6_9DIPT